MLQIRRGDEPIGDELSRRLFDLVDFGFAEAFDFEEVSGIRRSRPASHHLDSFDGCDALCFHLQDV